MNLSPVAAATAINRCCTDTDQAISLGVGPYREHGLVQPLAFRVSANAKDER